MVLKISAKTAFPGKLSLSKIKNLKKFDVF